MATRRDGGAGVSRRVLGLLAAWIAACLPAGEALPVPLPVPESEPPVAEAASADGRYLLRLAYLHWQTERSSDPTRRLVVCLGVKGMRTGEFVAWQDPLVRVVTKGGAVAPRTPAWEEVDRTNLSSARGEFTTIVDLPSGTTGIESLEYELPILRVASWEECVLEVPASGMAGPVHAGGWSLSGEAGPRICGVAVRQEETGLLDPEWGRESVEVRDGSGTRLRRAGWGDHRWSGFALPVPEGVIPGPLVYPVTARLRAPGDHSIERVRFEFRDLSLPPPDVGPARAAVATAPEGPAPTGMAWSPWSAPVLGVSMRALLPTAARRGDAVPVRARLRFDAEGLLPGVTRFDGRGFEDRLRLHFVRAATGTRVDLDQDEVEETFSRDDPADVLAGAEDPGCFPIRPGEVREWEVEFSLARAWDALGPGDWRVRASLDIAGEWRATSAWQGRVESGPVTLLIEDAPPRRMAVCVPGALRLRRGDRPGSVQVHYGPADADFVAIEARNGFLTGDARRDEEGGTEVFGWGDAKPHFHPEVDSIDAIEDGPLDRTYRFEIFEFPRVGSGGGYAFPHSDSRTYRVLWSGSLRVSASSEEVRELSGSVPARLARHPDPGPPPEPVFVAASGPDTGEIVIRVVDGETEGPIARATVTWKKPVGDGDAWEEHPVPATTVPGEFRFRGKPGLYAFQVEAGGFVAAGAYDNMCLEVEAGRTSERKIPLDRAGSARVRFLAEGVPVAPRQATLWWGHYGKFVPVENGTASWRDLPPGTVRLEVDAGPEFDPVADRELEVRPGEETSIVVKLDRRGPLRDATSGVRGTVTFHPAWGRGRTTVRFEPVGEEGPRVRAESEPVPCEPGKPSDFAVGRLPAGRYGVEVEPQWYEVVEVPVGGAHFDFQVPEPGVVRVRVVDEESGEDLHDATVWWWRSHPDRDSFPMERRTWDSDVPGFRFLAPPGEIQVSASAPGRRRTGPEDESLVLEAGREIECTIRLAR